MDNQTKEKKEEVMRGWGVDVLLGFLLVGFKWTRLIYIYSKMSKTLGLWTAGIKHISYFLIHINNLLYFK